MFYYLRNNNIISLRYETWMHFKVETNFISLLGANLSDWTSKRKKRKTVYQYIRAHYYYFFPESISEPNVLFAY